IFVFYFSLISYKVLKRRRQRLNIIFSAFFITIIIANILNMIYGAMTYHMVILILNFFTNFFLCFGPIFILIVNMIILESTLIFSVKRQNRFIILYGILLLLSMIPFYAFDQVWIEDLRPHFSGLFLFYILSFPTALAVIPIIYTSFKIYSSFETKTLKKKWYIYSIGTIGAFSIAYLVWISNFVFQDGFRLIVSFYSITVIIWGFFMYYGIGFKLKQ
ncbi:MAG: hypothetical protein ACFFBI_04415, partial [Promethearchaeota archaeon]